MRILVVHNSYRQRGGEDVVFEAESSLLRAHDHDVHTLEFKNTSISATPAPSEAARLAATTVWSRSGMARVEEAVRFHGIELVHFHNTFPLVSPAAYWGARRAGAAVVQTLHNYRLVCPNALFYRQRRPCEDCRGRLIAWPGVVHKCYRGSRGQSAVVATMQFIHRGLGSWQNAVDYYIALTHFAKHKFIEDGLPADRIVVKPNFVAGRLPPRDGVRAGFLFVGRLDESKGIPELLQAWAASEGPVLRIAGDGPLRAMVEDHSASSRRIDYMGYVESSQIPGLMQQALAVVFPSRWYEAFPLVIVEAFAA